MSGNAYFTHQRTALAIVGVDSAGCASCLYRNKRSSAVQQIDLPIQGLSELAANIRAKISSLPYGPERHTMLKAIWQSDVAAKLEQWINPLGSQLPR
jgi:hypothetical protein